MNDERQILIDVELNIPESILNEIVKQLKDFVKTKSWDNWITDIYWDDI